MLIEIVNLRPFKQWEISHHPSPSWLEKKSAKLAQLEKVVV
jgi:hypothetical protein